MNIIIYFIIFFGIINLLRMTFFLVGSDIYSLQAHFKSKKGNKSKLCPSVSVVIPAHNESMTILRAVRSVIRNKYPEDKKEIIVVDNNCTDDKHN